MQSFKHNPSSPIRYGVVQDTPYLNFVGVLGGGYTSIVNLSVSALI